MIAFFLVIKRKCPGLWNRMEDVNGLLFRIRYRRLPEKATEILKQQEVELVFNQGLLMMEKVD